MMRSIVRLRWINLIGAACFTVYGVLIESYPVAALNFAIVLINLYFLWKTSRRKEAFSVMEMPADSPYIAEFLRFYGSDIRGFQPDFAHNPAEPQHAIVTLRDLVPAGVVILKPRGDRLALVALDYVPPAYRDFRVGDYLFNSRRDVFAGLGIASLVSSAGNDAHSAYLTRIGFRRTGEDGYRLDLEAPAQVR